MQAAGELSRWQQMFPTMEKVFPVRVRGVVFDLDGTLLDTAPDLAEAANCMLAELDRPTLSEANVVAYVGNGAARLVKRLLTGEMAGEPNPALFNRAMDIFFRHYADVLTHRTQPFPGAVEGVETLKAAGFRLACVTNKPERFTIPLLEGMGLLQNFELVLSGDSLPKRKPDPLPLQHTAAQFGLEVSELLMVGDSKADIQAARAAGCHAVAVSYGYNHGEPVAELAADAVIDSLTEVEGLVIKA